MKRDEVWQDPKADLGEILKKEQKAKFEDDEECPAMLIGQGTSEDEDEPELGQNAQEEEETPAIPQVMKLDS